MLKNTNSLEVTKKTVDLLLIQCPPWDTNMPPLGIAYLSSYLRKYGHKTSVFDLNIILYHLVNDESKFLWKQENYDYWVNDDYFKNTWFRLREFTTISIEQALQEVCTEYIGLSVNFASIKFTIEFLKIIKYIKPEIKIIIGGWGCINDHMRSQFPKDLVDVFVVGEGEETLREIIEMLKGERETDGISGAIFTKDYSPVYKPRPAIINLDNIPWPTFSEFQLNQYKKKLPLFTSRGCIGNCSFCNDWYISRPYRFRSAENVFEEIKYHTKNHSIEELGFKDLLCNGNINRLNLLSDLIINSRIKIRWDSQAIPRKEMTYELLCKLKKSGCVTLIYGVESFSNNILKRMRKLFTKEIVEEAIKDTYAAGINTMINIIVGFPGETEEDFRETFEAIKRNRKYITQIGAISTCLVNNDADLEINHQNYGLVLSPNPNIRAKEWVSIDGKNTYKIRRKRGELILELIKNLGFSYETITI